MFFMMGIMPGRRELEHDQLIVCSRCGRYGRYMVYVTYNVLSLFFIPVFKWGRQYYAQARCCGATYRIDPEVGRQIERGEKVELRQEDLEYMGGGQAGYGDAGYRRCENCGYTTAEDFEYCPKCGRHF